MSANVPPLSSPESSARLATSITRAASLQTYFVIRCLADRPLAADAYRAYAYFRWVDDRLDGSCPDRNERLAFVNRQLALVERLTADARDPAPPDLSPEERMLADLIRRDRGRSRGLRSYVRNMMAVMAFDADRRGLLVSRQDLANYTRWLATAVTEALHYFIGNGQFSPRDDTRYLAASAAHIAHMLRDAVADAEAGYYNIPCEELQEKGIDPTEPESEAYRAWVKHRVELAEAHFQTGKAYLARVASLRCRLAGYTYVARFVPVLNMIRRDEYRLRAEYASSDSPGAAVRLLCEAFVAASRARGPARTRVTNR